jgi:hypothetical protein
MLRPGPLGTGEDVQGYLVTISGSTVTATNPTTGAIVVGTALAVPTDLSPDQAGPDVTVTWTDPAAGSVEVWRSDDGGAWALLDTVAHGTQTYTDEDVAAGSYRYRLRTASGTARSAYTAAVALVVVAVTAPVLSVEPANNAPAGLVTLTWTTPAGGGITQYAYQIADNENFTPPFADSGTSATSPVVTGPAPAGDFWLRVRVSAGYVGEWSNVVVRHFV